MSVNKSKSHVVVIPEDDANRQIADGFVLHARVRARQVQVVKPAGGWARVLDIFVEEYLPLLRRNQNTHVVMLVDFDGNFKVRRDRFDSEIPEDVQLRVFVIGPLQTPEALRTSLGKRFEDIGWLLADDCDADRTQIWDHVQLRHNATDRQRLRESVRDMLFPPVS